MSKDAKILRWSLMAGAIYFGCIAFAHTIGLKIPGLFIYFNVPSHPYQDHIIAFLAFGWATFFYVAADDPVDHPLPVKAILLSGAVAICGLSGINAFSDFGSFSPSIKVLPFWAQTLLLLGYLIWLLVFYQRSRPCKPT
jgi:hypothetical protein